MYMKLSIISIKSFIIFKTCTVELKSFLNRKKCIEKFNNTFANERIQHIAKVINFHENTQNSKNLRKVKLAEVCVFAFKTFAFLSKYRIFLK